jgi:hypothetical protein
MSTYHEDELLNVGELDRTHESESIDDDDLDAGDDVKIGATKWTGLNFASGR